MKSLDWEKRVKRLDLHEVQRYDYLPATTMTKWVVKMDVLLHDFSMKPQLNRKYFPFKCFGNFSVLRQLTTNPPHPRPLKRITWVHSWSVISGSLYSLFPSSGSEHWQPRPSSPWRSRKSRRRKPAQCRSWIPHMNWTCVKAIRTVPDGKNQVHRNIWIIRGLMCSRLWPRRN